MLIFLKKKFRAIYRKIDIFSEALIRFIFSQVAFTLLPIFVITIIRYAIGQHSDSTTFLTEIAFATTVFSGLTLTQAVELKRLQGDFHSFRLKLLIQAFALQLIFSVVTLSIIVLFNNGIEIKNISTIKSFQFFIFFMSIWWVFFIYLIKTDFEKRKTIIEEDTPIKLFNKHFEQSLVEAKQHLSFLIFASHRKQYVKLKIDKEAYEESDSMLKDTENSFNAQIDEIEKLVTELKKIRKNAQQDV